MAETRIMIKRKNSDESIPNIKEAALKLFAAKGYANTSLEEIANAAGFTKGAVYYYFKSKETLLVDILEDIEARSIGASMEAIRSSTGSAIDKMALFIDCQARWAGRFPNDLAILMLTSIETANDSNRVSERVKAIYDKMQTFLYEIIEEAKSRREIPKLVSTEDLVLTLMATHDGNMLLWYRSGRRPEVGKMLTAAARHMLLDKFTTLSKAVQSSSSGTSLRSASPAKASRATK